MNPSFLLDDSFLRRTNSPLGRRPAVRRCGRAFHHGLDPQPAGSWMHRPRTGASARLRRAGRSPANQRLSRPDWSFVDGLAGHRSSSLRSKRNTRPGRYGLSRHCLRLCELGNQVGTRRDYGSGHRLPGQAALRLRSGRRPGGARYRRSLRHRGPRCRHRCSNTFSGSRRKRLTGARKNLPGPWRREGLRRHSRRTAWNGRTCGLRPRGFRNRCLRNPGWLNGRRDGRCGGRRKGTRQRRAQRRLHRASRRERRHWRRRNGGASRLLYRGLQAWGRRRLNSRRLSDCRVWG